MRKIWFGIQLALDTLRGHKLRAFLTVLGVIIGTSTVIGVGSIIAGLDGAITNQLKSFGTNNLVVTKWDSLINGFGGRSLEERLRKPLTYENALAIAERCPSVSAVSPWLFAPWGIHKGKYKGVDAFNLNLGGTDPGYIDSGVEMMQGASSPIPKTNAGWRSSCWAKTWAKAGSRTPIPSAKRSKSTATSSRLSAS